MYSTPETDITAIGERGREWEGVWRGEVFVEENAAGERSSGTQVTGEAGTPATGAAGAAQARAGVGWEGG